MEVVFLNVQAWDEAADEIDFIVHVLTQLVELVIEFGLVEVSEIEMHLMLKPLRILKPLQELRRGLLANLTLVTRPKLIKLPIHLTVRNKLP